MPAGAICSAWVGSMAELEPVAAVFAGPSPNPTVCRVCSRSSDADIQESFLQLPRPGPCSGPRPESPQRCARSRNSYGCSCRFPQMMASRPLSTIQTLPKGVGSSNQLDCKEAGRTFECRRKCKPGAVTGNEAAARASSNGRISDDSHATGPRSAKHEDSQGSSPSAVRSSGQSSERAGRARLQIVPSRTGTR